LACAFALHLAFPRVGAVWLAPFALGGLFGLWMTLAPPAAATAGYAAGLVYFALSFSWFGETAGALLGPFGFILDLAPATIEALAFAVAAAIASLAAQRLRGPWIPIIAAAGFTVMELLRSSGVLGVPLSQIGAAFVETPLAPLAGFGGVYLLTFAVALLGAALGAAIAEPDRRRAVVQTACIALATGAAAAAAWAAWPARHAEPHALRVAAVQGNITQSVKWEAASLAPAVARYTTLTNGLRPFKPRFVLWPETVIATDLLIDPALAAIPQNAALAASGARLRRQFRALAGSLGAVIAVGSDEATAAAAYDDLLFFSGDRDDPQVYRKRRLVPFAEFLPGPEWLRELPFANLVSRFASGSDVPPIGKQLRVGPLICWEAVFTELAQMQAGSGARFLAVATDDAWFGASDGPYAQAQIAQLRAIETGRWIVRAAATGISGIIAPDGYWQSRSELDTQGVVTGTIGEPQPTVYSRLGPWPIGIALAALVAAAFALAGGRARA
jgi:apolipoprotein N-acyltransferase